MLKVIECDAGWHSQAPRTKNLRTWQWADVPRERTVRAAHLVVRVIRVPPTRIREYEHRSVTETLLLQPERDCTPAVRKPRAENGDTDERDDLRAIARDLSPRPCTPADVFLTRQHIHSRRGSGDQVGDPIPPIRQPLIVDVRDPLSYEATVVEQFPEPVREPRKVMAGQRRADARVDADEQHADTWTNPVAQQRQPRAVNASSRSRGGRDRVRFRRTIRRCRHRPAACARP